MKLRFVLASAALLAAPAFAEEPFDVLPPLQHDERNPDFAPIQPGPSAENCRDRIHTIREGRGLPPLPQRDSFIKDDVLHTYAVDRRIDGCNVLVMANGSGDIRPLPDIPEDAPLLRPLQ